MAGKPWEKYQQASSGKPWEKYQQQPEAITEPSSEQPSSVLDEQFLGMTPRGLIKGGLATLPTVGTLLGGAAGGAAGLAAPIPGGAAVGAAGGAGLGAAAGESLRQIGEKYLLGEGPKSTEQYYKDVAKEGLLGATSEAGGQALGIGAKAVAETKPVKWLGEKVSNIAAKVGSTLSGVTEKEIKTYAKHADQIKEMAKASDSNVALAADEVRGKFFADIDATRKAMNQKISKALEKSQASVDATNVLTELEKAKKTINAKLYPEQITQVDDLIGKIKNLGVESEGKFSMSVQDLNDVKSFLQEKASTAYRSPGEIFALGKESAKVAKNAGGVARDLVNKAAPEIAEANKTLSKLHNIEDNMNLNLIAPGKPESALLAAGSGGNVRNVEYLKELGNITGTDMLGEAEKLAAMRTFGSPALIAADTTGKSLARMTLGAGAAGAVGGLGAAPIGGFLASPAAIKAAIDAGLISKKALQSETGKRLLMRGLLQNAENQRAP